MNFKEAAILGSYLSKEYTEDLFRLLSTYSSISSSEAASRLNLHIKTVQDFMEDLFRLNILDREEVYEGKRPYYRYRLKVNRISVDIDLAPFLQHEIQETSEYELKIREKKNSGARFTTSRSNDYISSVAIWSGDGRNRKERKINLSIPQGKFLFHLPFPTAGYLSISEIMAKAGVDRMNAPEILDIVYALTDMGVIEKEKDTPGK